MKSVKILATVAVATVLLAGCASAPTAAESGIARDCAIAVAEHEKQGEKLEASVATLAAADVAGAYEAFAEYTGALRGNVLAQLPAGEVADAFGALVDGYDQYTAFYGELKDLTTAQMAEQDYTALNAELTEIQDALVAAAETFDSLCAAD